MYVVKSQELLVHNFGGCILVCENELCSCKIYSVPVVEVRVWGISWKAGQMLLSLPQSALQSTEAADSVIQHHGLQKS